MSCIKSSSLTFHATPAEGKTAYLLPCSKTDEPSLLATNVNRYLP